MPTPLNNFGTVIREATHSVPTANQNASSPSHITREYSRVFPQTIASSPPYSLSPHRILQLSRQPIRRFRAPHPGLSTLLCHIHCSMMRRRNALRSRFHKIQSI
ncbi:hypothetical protein TNCV_4185181 [Trichonephila clavipes]|nr:hypothetical protein TNCV_4185181 [Trichonephila clavipes]